MRTKLPETWDMEADVVVVGYGGAGAVSAITAHDYDADTVILEKMADGGGNTRVCGGMILIPRSKGFADYLNTLSYKTTDHEIIDIFVEEAMKHTEWFKEMGATLESPAGIDFEYTFPKFSRRASFPHVKGSDEMDKVNVVGEVGAAPSLRLWQFLSSNVEKRGIRIETGTPAKELLTNHNGEVIGVIAIKDGKDVSIKAKKGVILTCGGYENNPQLKWDYLAAKPVRFAGNPGNTGDGIRMVQNIGGDLWHMTSLSCAIGFQPPEYEAAFVVLFPNEGFIYVDKQGKRFVGESHIEIHEFGRKFSEFDTDRVEFPYNPCYAIFDDETRRRAPLTSSLSGYYRGKYKWSPDNSAEVDKGWIIKGKNIADLAKQISVDAAVLENTIKQYNEYCDSGKDEEFGRPIEDLRALEPPYYAIKLEPTLLNTQGGPRRDKEARVIDTEGNPIPRLYSAGELGSIWGYLYQGANNISECVVFGRIAGKNAANNKPWSN